MQSCFKIGWHQKKVLLGFEVGEADLFFSFIMDLGMEYDSEEEEAFVYVYDRRKSSTNFQRHKVSLGGLFGFVEFQKKVCEVWYI